MDGAAGFTHDQDRYVVHTAPHGPAGRELVHGADPVPPLRDHVRHLFGVVGPGRLTVGEVAAQHAADSDRRQSQQAVGSAGRVASPEAAGE